MANIYPNLITIHPLMRQRRRDRLLPIPKQTCGAELGKGEMLSRCFPRNQKHVRAAEGARQRGKSADVAVFPKIRSGCLPSKSKC